MIALDLPIDTKHVAVALSGGPDSWALALLAYDWCQKHGASLTALTIDHALRPESATEAAAVAAECAKRGIEHVTLVWKHEAIESGLQEQARHARYTLLTDYCRTHNIPLLLTAHHADDQSETVLLRFAKASDVGGLGGLHPTQMVGGITLLRPLLGYTKEQLVDYATTAGVPFVTDPSNGNTRFARARLRDARSVLEAEGLSTANLLRLAGKMRAADDALDFATDEFILRYASLSHGATTLPLSVIANKPAALQQRALLHLWREVTHDAGHPIEYDQLQRLQAFVQQAGTGKVTTAGMVIEKTEALLVMCREAAACAAPITIQSNSQAVWDARFTISNGTDAPVTIGALGEFGRERIDTLGAPYAWLHALTPAARASLPAQHNGAQRLPLLHTENIPGCVTAMVLPLKLKTKTTETTLYSA